ncbi:MAG: WD40 repeat domain-containing protein [Candidatus Bipolaricaulota bacterium]|nr:WD40 repeat domain-containing protein [Candidatus Bipolaricaulota bacterium]
MNKTWIGLLVVLGVVGAAAPVATLELKWLSSAAFSPDGAYLAVGTHYGVVLYRTRDWKEAGTLAFPEASVSALAFSRDGALLAAGALNEVRVWTLPSRELVGTVRGPFGRVLGFAFVSPGELLIGGSDGSLSLWELGAAAPRWVKTPHTVQVRSVEVSPDGALAATAGHDRAVLWDTRTWTELRSLPGKAWDVAFTPDGYFLVVGWGKVLRVWDTAVGFLYHNELWGHESCAITVAASPDGRFLLSGSLDETARLWDAETGVCLAVLGGHGAVVAAVGFSPDGNLLFTASDNGRVLVWLLDAVLAQR